MASRISREPAPALAADVTALFAFVTIGLVSHHHGFLRGYARDLPTFVGCWIAAGLAFRLYRRPGSWRLAGTWAVGVPAAVLLRALILGHPLDGSEAAFLGVSLVTIAVLVLVSRWAITRLSPPVRRAGSSQHR